MKDLIQKQRNYFESQRTLELKFRVQQLTKLEQALRSNESLLYEAIYNDFKKSKFETYASELGLVYHDIKEAKNKLHQWSRKQKVKTNFVNFPGSSYIIPEPLGVCLVIGAWNYPYLLSLAPLIAALSAGNTIVLKPSEIPSHTAAAMKHVLSKASDEEYIAVVEGGIPETTQLLQQQFDKIFFTGSTAVGKIVYKAAAEHLTPVTLELGGKSPAIVTKDCNLKMTVKRLIWAKFLNAGQTCVAPDYVLVDKSIESKFLAQCKLEIDLANYAFDNDNYVQIINDRNFQRLKGLLDNDKVYCGGTTDAEERFFEPTILSNVSMNDAVMQDEIFGPILPVLSYATLEEAISKVQLLPKPLSAYVFSSKNISVKKILKQLSFGGGSVNDAVMHISNPNLPFGGVGASGLGNYHGKAGFDSFTHHKSILKKPTWFELSLKYAPLTAKKLWWIKQFMKL